jgi:hypothetical protein
MVITMTTTPHYLLKSPKIGPLIHALSLRFIIEWGITPHSVIEDYGLQKNESTTLPTIIQNYSL